jgi:hypothetical protein
MANEELKPKLMQEAEALAESLKRYKTWDEKLAVARSEMCKISEKYGVQFQGWLDLDKPKVPTIEPGP